MSNLKNNNKKQLKNAIILNRITQLNFDDKSNITKNLKSKQESEEPKHDSKEFCKSIKWF